MFWCRWYQKKVLRNTRCHGKGLAPRCLGHYQLAAFLIARQVLLNAEPESVVWHLSKIGSVDTYSQAKKRNMFSSFARRSCDNSRFGKMCSDCRWEFQRQPIFPGASSGTAGRMPQNKVRKIVKKVLHCWMCSRVRVMRRDCDRWRSLGNQEAPVSALGSLPLPQMVLAPSSTTRLQLYINLYTPHAEPIFLASVLCLVIG